MSYLAYTPKPSYEVLEAAYKDLLVRHGALEQEHSSVQQQIGQYVANLEQHAANHAANLEQHTANLLAEASQQVAALSKKNEELTKKCDQHKLVVKNSNRRSAFAKSKYHKAAGQVSALSAKCEDLEEQLKIATCDNEGLIVAVEWCKTDYKEREIEICTMRHDYEAEIDSLKHTKEAEIAALKKAQETEISALKQAQEMEITSLKQAQETEITALKQSYGKGLKEAQEMSARASKARKSARREARTTKRAALQQKLEGQNELRADFRAAVAANYEEKFIEQISLAETELYDRIRAHYRENMALARLTNAPGLAQNAVYKTSTEALDAAMAQHTHVRDIATQVLEAHQLAMCVDQVQESRAARRDLQKQSLEMAKLKRIEEQLGNMSKRLEGKKTKGREEDETATSAEKPARVEKAEEKEKEMKNEKPEIAKPLDIKRKKQPAPGKREQPTAGKSEQGKRERPTALKQPETKTKTLREQIREKMMEKQVAELLAEKKPMKE